MAPRLLLSVVVLFLAMTGAALSEPKRILFIHSFGRDFAPWNEFAKYLRAEFDDQSAAPLEFYETSLATERFGAGQDEDPFADYLQKLFVARRLDLIVAIGAPAVRFTQKYRDRLFPAIPCLITGLDQRTVSPLTLTANDAAVAISIDIPSVFENILRVAPQTKDIAVIVGNSPLEKFWLQQMQSVLEPFKNRVSFTWFNDLSFAEMLKRVAAPPPHSAIFFAVLSVDMEGRSHEDARAFKALRAAAQAPIFSYIDTYFGGGIVGGPLIPIEKYARQAASVGMRILAGEPPNSIKTDAIKASQPEYDWRELQRWNISESRLPPGSEIHFRSPSMWEQYRSQVTAALAALLLQTGLISWLLLERSRRHFAQAEADSRRWEVLRLNRVATANVLSSSIAHELNQPLGAILSNTEAAQILLRANPPDIAQVIEILSDIVRDDQRAGEIILGLKNLLNNRNEVELQLCDLNETVREVVRIISPEAARRIVVVDIECTSDVLSVRADPVHLQQVIINLAMNGMDAMDNCESRDLTIRTQRSAESEAAEIIVTDSGEGISKESLANIFDAFFTTKPQGTGLGLPIARTIVESYGGTIWAENCNRGAAFRVVIPLAKTIQ